MCERRLVSILVSALALGIPCAGCRGKVANSSAKEDVAIQTADPRLTYQTPYRNVRPEVKYVGDDACAACHPIQTESFHQHPMGRSLAPMAARAAQQRYDPAAHNPFTAEGFQFLVERRGDKVIHKESRRDARGQPISEMDAEIHYSVGSGEHGHSYLIERDGYLFQSPVTWYTQKQAWDLSPGFTADMHADRQIQPGCVFCHCNQAEPVPNTLNHYRLPVFRGCAIGCERCHGPGELHVARRQAGELVEGRDDTIVNPRRLPPALRESVCQQCHLNGDVRILRRGREEFDYRPGLPMHLFWSVYVRRPGFTDENKSVNHVQQMVESRCFQESKGELGCISCHDPHAIPAADKKTVYYRDRCLKCHGGHGCSLAPTLRQEKKDDCAACHMAPFASTDIAHTAFTDHRVLRRPDRSTSRPTGGGMLRPGEIPVVHFHQAILDLPARETARDQGVALIELARHYPSAQMLLAPMAVPLLERAVQDWPDDAAADEARGFALWLTGKSNEAMAAYRDLLERVPEREVALLDAAFFSAQLGRNDDAIAYWRRLLKVNPWATRYHHQLATLLAGKGQWQEAYQECQAVLRLNPASPETRQVFVNCLLRTGNKEQARSEFDKLLAMNPKDAVKLRQWFTEQAH